MTGSRPLMYTRLAAVWLLLSCLPMLFPVRSVSAGEVNAFPVSSPAGRKAEYALPVYHLNIAEADLGYLLADPYRDEYVPAMIIMDGASVDCQVRFRGATSRKYPKKSWRVKFTKKTTPFENRTSLNLNADYIDPSHMRNYLAFSLFRHMGHPAPDISFVNLVVNGKSHGVFSALESLDEEFLENNGRPEGSLYKAVNHGANMSPLTRKEWYDLSWEHKNGDVPDHRDIRDFFSWLRYSSDTEFMRDIEARINTENVLSFFAVVFATSSTDNCTKNFYLYRHPATGKYEIFPWDFDAAFGLDWQGNYVSGLETITAGTFLDYQVLLQRLLAHPQYRAAFAARVQAIVSGEFTWLHTLVDSTFTAIRHDVYADPLKRQTNEEFDASIGTLHQFLNARQVALAETAPFQVAPIRDVYCSNPFPTPQKPEVTFRAVSPDGVPLSLYYAEDLDFTVYGDPFTGKYLRLFDDGLHDDLAPGDRIFGNTYRIPEGFTGLIPYSITTGNYYYPWNGLFYVNYYRTDTPALNCLNPDGFPAHAVTIGEVYRDGDDCLIEISNTSAQTVDISYCFIRGATASQTLLIPELTTLAPGASVMVATDSLLSKAWFPERKIAADLFFTVSIGDTVRLLAPNLSVFDSLVCERYGAVNRPVPSLVISEINYHSPDEFDPGDWVELYNADSRTVDLTGWILKDSKDDNAYELPSVHLPSQACIVLCADVSAFRELAPECECAVGDLGFSLGNGGEHLRLYDHRRIIVDSLTYDDKAPWPEAPDGSGSTLVLRHPALDNSRPESWSASIGRGTPGRISLSDAVDEWTPSAIRLNRNRPNPFNGHTVIGYTLRNASEVKLSVYDTLGQRVAILVNGFQEPGEHTIPFDAGTLGSGIYFCHLEAAGVTCIGKMLLVK